MQSPAFVRFMERLGAERLRSFSTYDFLTLDYVQRDRPLPDHLRARISGLIDAGVIQSIGRGRGTRYILSQMLSAALGARGVHTRKKGLDHETNKALLEQHLRERGYEGAPLVELRQVLPAEPKSAVQQLLTELRSEGRIQLRGRRRWARWLIQSAKDLKTL